MVSEDKEDEDSMVSEDKEDEDSMVGEDKEDEDSMVGEDKEDEDSMVGEDTEDEWQLPKVTCPGFCLVRFVIFLKLLVKGNYKCATWHVCVQSCSARLVKPHLQQQNLQRSTGCSSLSPFITCCVPTVTYQFANLPCN